MSTNSEYTCYNVVYTPYTFVVYFISKNKTKLHIYFFPFFFHDTKCTALINITWYLQPNSEYLHLMTVLEQTVSKCSFI